MNAEAFIPYALVTGKCLSFTLPAEIASLSLCSVHGGYLKCECLSVSLNVCAYEEVAPRARVLFKRSSHERDVLFEA